MVFGPSSHDPNRKLFDNFDPNAPSPGTLSNPFSLPPGSAPPRQCPPPTHSLSEPPLNPASRVRSRDASQDLSEPSKSSEQQRESAPDETLGGTWELEPPPINSPPPQPTPALFGSSSPRPFPFAAMDNLMHQLREEANRKVRRTPEEVAEEERVEKEKVEEHWRQKREREKNTWSSCHLFADGTGMSRSGPIVRDENGVVRYEEWPKTNSENQNAILGAQTLSGATAVPTSDTVKAISSPEKTEAEKKPVFVKIPRNPFDDEPNSHQVSWTEKKRHQECAPTDTDDEEEVESMLQALSLAEGKGGGVARKAKMSEKTKLEEETEQKELNRMSLAEIDAGWNCHYSVKGMASPTTVSRNPYIDEMKKLESKTEKESIEEPHMAIEEETLSGTTGIRAPEDAVREEREAFPSKRRNPFDKPNPFTQLARNRMQQLKIVGIEDEEERESKLARERFQQMEITGQQNKISDEQTLSGTTIVSPTVSGNHPLDAVPSPEDSAREKKRLSKQRLNDHFNPEVAESGRASLALKAPLSQRSKFQFEVDSDDDEDEDELENAQAIGRLNALARATAKEVEVYSSCCFYPSRSKNGDVDEQIKMNRARLDRIR